MAPKKEKAPKAPPPPPSDWIPESKSKDFMDCNEAVVTHLRAGRADAVRAKPLLAQGRFRITYEITHSSSPVAQDMLLGVCDATAWSTGDDKDVSAHDMIEALFSEQKLKHSTFSKHGHAVAWGFDPKRGQLELVAL